MSIKEELEELLERNVYFADLVDSVRRISEETLEDSECLQGICCTCFDREETECNCVKNKQIRDGVRRSIMTSGFISLEEVKNLIVKMSLALYKDIKKKSFVCDCPPELGIEDFLVKEEKRTHAEQALQISKKRNNRNKKK